jgi:hypothetical protein
VPLDQRDARVIERELDRVAVPYADALPSYSAIR